MSADEPVPWPSTTDEPRSPVEQYREPLNDTQPQERKKSSYLAERRLDTWNMIALSISMLGVQISWAVELAYGTPYLLSLGLSDQATSLVWLAGPLSGLIAQPVIGALSDSSTSRFRRRAWVIGCGLALVVTGLMLAFATDLASFLILVTGGEISDPQKIRTIAIPIAIVAFFLFDFAVNGIQASLRNLLLDITPQDQLSIANAWQSRMLHAGSVIGNGIGFWDLGSLLYFLGGDQFRKFCLAAMFILVVTVTITVVTQDEKQGSPSFGRNKNKLSDVLLNISRVIFHLPRPIRRVCYVQIFSWIGWFPFLFFSTTYVGQVMAFEIGADPDNDVATRAGEFALFLWSIVAILAGILIPYLAARDQRLLSEGEDDEPDAEIARIRSMVRTWKSEAARQGRPLKLPTMPFMLRNIWTSSLLLFAILMFSTFFVRTVFWATCLITVSGICWAVTCWVPFSILMEYLKEVDSGAVQQGAISAGSRPAHPRALSTPAFRVRGGRLTSGERVPLLRRYSLKGDDELPLADDLSQSKKPLAGGTVLGIHNLAVVIPQFIVSIVASVIFKFANRNANPGDIYLGKNGVAWVLRFGGICALIAAMISRMVPPTKTEKEMRRRFAEMQFSEDRSSP